MNIRRLKCGEAVEEILLTYYTKFGLVNVNSSQAAAGENRSEEFRRENEQTLLEGAVG